MRNFVNARVTFHSSPIHVLERFTFKDPHAALSRFRRSGLDECVILQTCNRVELFGSSGRFDPDIIRSTWASLAGLDESDFGDNIQYGRDRDVFEHLLRLASGLDSMVVGEEQILGQIRDSISAARASGSSGLGLNTLFDRAIRTGTRIRNSTGIGRGGVSVGSMAVRLAEENIDEMRSKRILLIGTGEVSTLVAKSLTRRGYGFSVASRTLGRSEAFCKALGGAPVRFESVLSGFGEYDVLFVATSAPYFLVTFERIVQAMGGRSGGMMILDLSNPRTVDERVATLGGIKLMNLDQIAEMVERNMRSRMTKARAVEGMIGAEVSALEAAMNRLDAEPVISDVFRRIDALRQKELRKALRMLGEQDESRVRIIDDLTRAIAEGIVSVPMNNLRRASEHGRSEIMDAASRLFDYDCGAESAPQTGAADRPARPD